MKGNIGNGKQFLYSGNFFSGRRAEQFWFIGTPKFSQKRVECSLIKVIESFEAWTRHAGFLCVAAERGEVRDAGEMSKKDTNSSTKGL